MSRNADAQASIALARLRSLCLALPEAEERETWERATFRVRGKIFAMFATHDAAPAVWCKAPPGAQQILLGADPHRFFRPPYVGPKGWIGVRLDVGVDWTELDALVRRSHEMTAPKPRRRTTQAATSAPPNRARTPARQPGSRRS
jgi:predicted DNA-binding protein (MmcQ/YjbR family)